MKNLKKSFFKSVAFSALLLSGLSYSQNSFALTTDEEFDLLCKALPKAIPIQEILDRNSGAFGYQDYQILMSWINAVTGSSFHDGILTRRIHMAYQSGKCQGEVTDLQS